MKNLLLLTLLAFLTLAAPARAQQGRLEAPDAPQSTTPSKEPAYPAPIKTLADQGAQVRYIGREHGLDGWITVKDGHTQYFYAPLDQSYLLMGLLFEPDGKLETVKQVKALQDKAGHTLDTLATPPPPVKGSTTPGVAPAMSQFKTPAEQLYDNIANANWIQLGDTNAPLVYAFIDPQCPHCQGFLKDTKAGYVDSGQLQIRAVPIGFKEDTVAQAAYLLAAPDAPDRLYKYINGDKTALPITPGINEQGVERNLAIMQSWKFDVTPLIVYRDGQGKVKIVRGRPKSIPAMIADLQKKGATAGADASP